METEDAALRNNRIGGKLAACLWLYLRRPKRTSSEFSGCKWSSNGRQSDPSINWGQVEIMSKTTTQRHKAQVADMRNCGSEVSKKRLRNGENPASWKRNNYWEDSQDKAWDNHTKIGKSMGVTQGILAQGHLGSDTPLVQ